MIVDKLNRNGTFWRPDKAYSKLVVHACGMLACAMTPQGFKPIGRRAAKIVEVQGGVRHHQLASCHCGKVSRKTLRNVSLQDGSQALIPKTDDGHAKICIMS